MNLLHFIASFSLRLKDEWFWLPKKYQEFTIFFFFFHYITKLWFFFYKKIYNIFHKTFMFIYRLYFALDVTSRSHISRERFFFVDWIKVFLKELFRMIEKKIENRFRSWHNEIIYLMFSVTTTFNSYHIHSICPNG